MVDLFNNSECLITSQQPECSIGRVSAMELLALTFLSLRNLGGLQQPTRTPLPRGRHPTNELSFPAPRVSTGKHVASSQQDLLEMRRLHAGVDGEEVTLETCCSLFDGMSELTYCTARISRKSSRVSRTTSTKRSRSLLGPAAGTCSKRHSPT